MPAPMGDREGNWHLPALPRGVRVRLLLLPGYLLLPFDLVDYGFGGPLRRGCGLKFGGCDLRLALSFRVLRQHLWVPGHPLTVAGTVRPQCRGTAVPGRYEPAFRRHERLRTRCWPLRIRIATPGGHRLSSRPGTVDAHRDRD
jgi:hypothetical protein